MASKFIPLDDAARMLGVSPERLVELRSNGEIRGFRDGKSWKFPEAEIERLLSEGGVDVEGDADAGESSILVSEHGTGVGKSGSTVIGADQQGEEEGSGHGSDVGVGEEGAGSDVAVVPHHSGGSDVKLVASGDSGEVQGEDLDEASEEDFQLEPNAGQAGAPETGGESSVSDDDLRLMEDEDPMADLSPSGSKPKAPGENVLSDDDVLGTAAGGTGDLIHGDSDVGLGGEVASGSDATPISQDDDDLVIAGDEDDEDDLVLSGGSDVSVAGDSGINLMSPSDSGLSLEGEPLDLAGSSISALDLGSEAKGGKEGSGSESGSLVDFQADEEFQLSPSGVGLETDEDSGSQVIEVDDSAEAFGDEVDLGGAEVVEDAGEFGDVAMVGDDALVADEGFGGEEEAFAGPAGQGAYAGARPAYEVPFSPLQVATLVCILVVLSIGGMMMTDLVRNMAGYAGGTAPVSSLTDAILGMLGMDS